MLTSARVFVEEVPWRRAFCSALTVSWTSAMWNSSPKTPSSRSTLPVLPRYGALFHGADLHGPALGPRHGAAEQEQAQVGDHVDAGEAAVLPALVLFHAR